MTLSTRRRSSPLSPRGRRSTPLPRYRPMTRTIPKGSLLRCGRTSGAVERSRFEGSNESEISSDEEDSSDSSEEGSGGEGDDEGDGGDGKGDIGSSKASGKAPLA
jgi:hypothetical protein